METVKKIGERPVLRLPFKEVPNAFIIVSFKHGTINKAHMDHYIKYQEPYFPDEPFMTFFYAGENCGAEWEPTYGPIMLYTKCDENWRGSTYHGTELKPKPHWYYDLVEDNSLAWSQMAVEEEGLKRKLKAGDFEGIFAVLRRWTNRD